MTNIRLVNGRSKHGAIDDLKTSSPLAASFVPALSVRIVLASALSPYLLEATCDGNTFL